MISTITIYDFEGNIPDMIAVAFNPEMNTYTLNTAPAVQKLRPRCDIMFRGVSSAPGPRIMPIQFPGMPIPIRGIGAYEGDLELDLITEPSAAGKSQHSAYRAAVRATLELDPLRNAVNLNTTPYQIDFLLCTSASDTVKTSDGYETSKLVYHVQFSIKQTAFNQLAGAAA